jgi:hypothetical protein
MSNHKKQNSTRTKEIDATLKRARVFADYWEGRKRRASERLDESGNQQRAWHFALLGLHAPFDRADLAYGCIRQVVEPPSEVELAGALKQAGLFSTVARYTRGLAYELVLPVYDFDEQAVLTSLGGLLRPCTSRLGRISSCLLRLTSLG